MKNAKKFKNQVEFLKLTSVSTFLPYIGDEKKISKFPARAPNFENLVVNFLYGTMYMAF